MTLHPDPRAPGLLAGDGVEIGEDVEFGAHVVLHDGCRIGEGCRIGDFAVLGKRPALGPASTAKRTALPGLVLGARCTVASHAVVFAGSTLGDGTIVGDMGLVRERCTIGPDCVIGARATVENDTTLGARCKLQAHAYVTADSTLEDDVFIAPCVVTTNDNFMGRTEARHALRRGPTIRRGARVGGGAVLLPRVEIGEEAFVAAGAVVTRDVPPRTLVVGAPARRLRDVPYSELLGATDQES